MGTSESNPNSTFDPADGRILPNKSMNDPFWSHLSHCLDERRQAGLYRQVVATKPVGPSKIVRNGVLATNFGSNDYLGLSWNREIVQAATDADLAVGRFGSGASPLVTGHTEAHQKLTEAIARFQAHESALVFSSGYAANVGTISALAQKEDVIFSDQLNHASIIDGCRLSSARVLVYPHRDVESLRRLIEAHRAAARFGFVVTDSVFSMDGDVAPLLEIVALCQEFDLQCIIDEAHATGVYGHHGRGLVEHLQIESNRIIHIGTLSKGIGCVGGFVSGSKLLIDWLTNSSRSWIYSTATLLPNAVAATQALSLVTHMQEARIALRNRSVALRSQIASLGFRVGAGDSPIVPVYLHESEKVLVASEQLLQRGHYVPAIRPPTVPTGQALLRISLSLSHSEQEIAALVDSIAKCV